MCEEDQRTSVDKRNKNYWAEPYCDLKHPHPPVLIISIQSNTASNSVLDAIISPSWKHWTDVLSEAVSQPNLMHFCKDFKITFLDERSADCLFLPSLAASLKALPCQGICLSLKLNFSYDVETQS